MTLLDYDSRFVLRSCPCCGSSDGDLLFDLEAEQFCSVNWSYSTDIRQLLDLPLGARFPIYRCRGCRFVYARLLPPKEFLSCVYEQIILHEECLKGSENKTSYARRMRYVASLIDLAPRQESLRALDFGCGVGVTSRMLSCAGVETFGYDSSRSRADYVKSKAFTIVRDEQTISEHGPYDIIVCDNVLEHVSQPLQTAGFLASVGRSDAVLYVSVPDYEGPFIEQQLAAIRAGHAVDMSLNPWEHLNYFSLFHLDNLLAKHGFFPITATQLVGHVDIGLRPEASISMRLKNGMASMYRLSKYVVTGNSLRNVNGVFYRLSI